MSVDNATRTLGRKRDELSSLNKKVADAQKKVSDAMKKEASAKAALSKAKTATTIKSKQRSLASASNAVVSAQKALGDLEGKRSKKAGEVAAAEKALDKERNAETAKAQKKQEEAIRRSERELASQSAALNEQGRIVQSIGARVDRLETLPDKITVLMLSSGPKDADHLDVDVEAREIRDAIVKTRHRDSIDLQDRWAVRTGDIFQSLNETEPTIVHFSGHGTDDGELVFVNDFGLSKPVPPEALALMLGTLSDRIRLAVFNACFSETQAAAVTSSIEAAIGMTTSISDGAAIAFATQLFSSRGFGLSLARAFSQAKAQLAIDYTDELNTPRLYCADGVNPDEVFYVTG